MLLAVIDMNIVVTNGADLNHLLRKILKRDFIIFIRLQKNQLEMHYPREVSGKIPSFPRNLSLDSLANFLRLK